MGSVLAVLFAVGAAAATGHWVFGPHLPHYNNSVRARAITLGTKRSVVIDELGDPIGSDGAWTFFTPSPTAAGPIRVRFDNAGRVIKVDADGK